MNFKQFLQDEQGQDLIEYTLLLMFVALSSTVVLADSGKSIGAMWVSANGQIANVAVAAR